MEKKNVLLLYITGQKNFFLKRKYFLNKRLLDDNHIMFSANVINFLLMNK